jgi:NAD(P)H-hydrate epimerase
MKSVINAKQFKELDAHSIANEPIASIDLMERAAKTCVQQLLIDFPKEEHFLIVCGTGNNGGDGLAIARLLAQLKKEVKVLVFGDTLKGSADFKRNLERLKKLPIEILSSLDDVSATKENTVVIDCLFGNGLTRPIGGELTEWISFINQSPKVLSIDLPSGMASDPVAFNHYSNGLPIVRANTTYTFDSEKMNLLFDDLRPYFGQVTCLDIGLDKNFKRHFKSNVYTAEHSDAKTLLVPKAAGSHKGQAGHGLLMAGSRGMLGACILSAKASLRCGMGLLTVHGPGSLESIIHTTLPEAMFLSSNQADYIDFDHIDYQKYSAFALGMGVGKKAEMIDRLIENIQIIAATGKPFLVDADALNALSQRDIVGKILKGTNCIITPHLKEFDRLFGEHSNCYERYKTLQKQSSQLGITILLKGATSILQLPDGSNYFFPFPNPGLGKGGSGDVLSGIILSFLAQGYSIKDAGKLGVLAQSYAAELAQTELSAHSMLPTDVIDRLSDFFVHNS